MTAAVLEPGTVLLGWLRDELARTPLFLGAGLDEPLVEIRDEQLQLDSGARVLWAGWPCPYHHIRGCAIVSAYPQEEVLYVTLYGPLRQGQPAELLSRHAFVDRDGGSTGVWGAYWCIKAHLLAVLP